ncbi:MAG: carboxypeptidase-like regulatory domain-containing protein, partial [Cyclobacteriaceae bacterium]
MKNRFLPWINLMGKFSIYALVIALITFNALLASSSRAQGVVSVKEARISLRFVEKPLNEAFQIIENNTEYTFVYKQKDLDPAMKVTIDVEDETIETMLIGIARQANVSFRQVNDRISVKVRDDQKQNDEIEVIIEDETISGTVYDENGEGLPGATVIEKGTSNGTITDVQGNFVLDIEEGAVLQISFVGYTPKEVKVSGQTVLSVSLQLDLQSLDEVVVIGYGVMNKSDQTGAIGSINGEKIFEPSSSVVSEGLIGKMAGVDISSSTYSGEQPNIIIRGVRSLNASNSPLVIIDGVPGSLSTISPYDIKSIEVLKDASSAAVFGTRAANGVILVTTKRAPDSKYAISYNTSFGVNKLNLVNMMSGSEYAQFRRDGVQFNNGWDSGAPSDESVFFPQEIDAISQNDYHDWQKLFFRDGLVEQHNLSLGYKENKTSFTLSGTLMNDRGYIPTNSFSKQNVNFSLDHELKNWVDFGATMRYTRNKLDGLTTPSNAEIYYMNPFSNPRDDNGDLIDFPSEVESAAYNILANTRSG